jgi:hypothetical protein
MTKEATQTEASLLQVEVLRRAQMLLCEAQEEIKRLRSQVDYLAPRSEAYGAIVKVLGMISGPGQGYGPDVAWAIERFLQEHQSASASFSTEPSGSDN